METINLKNAGYTLSADIKSVPVAFVNGLRRILTAEIPTVVLTNVDIVENTTSMTHEMLRHRVEQIPVAVLPTETGVIRDTKVELRIVKAEKVQDLMTDDFVITGPRKDVLLKDRDLETSGIFLGLAPGQSLHIRASLGVESRGIAQCVATYKNHIDPERARLDKDTWILEGNDPREFDNFHIQRSYSRDENGRPNWFDFSVDSIGIAKASDLIKTACEIYKTKIEAFAAAPIERHARGYRVKVPDETYTLGALMQAILYDSALAEWASMTIGHPLLPELVVDFETKVAPEKVVARVKEEALALCENVLKSL
jgi:DNA-directed RNA polymerase subunit L